jgi:plasmid stability protein
MQYTIRNIPERLDAVLRERARREKKSLNQVALEALARAVGFSGEPVRFRNLDGIAGSWREDPAFDEAVSAQHSIDEEKWS